MTGRAEVARQRHARDHLGPGTGSRDDLQTSRHPRDMLSDADEAKAACRTDACPDLSGVEPAPIILHAEADMGPHLGERHVDLMGLGVLHRVVQQLTADAEEQDARRLRQRYRWVVGIHPDGQAMLGCQPLPEALESGFEAQGVEDG